MMGFCNVKSNRAYKFYKWNKSHSEHIQCKELIPVALVRKKSNLLTKPAVLLRTYYQLFPTGLKKIDKSRGYGTLERWWESWLIEIEERLTT